MLVIVRTFVFSESSNREKYNENNLLYIAYFLCLKSISLSISYRHPIRFIFNFCV
nr:MAG TPA: hypothetical protein [Caudoviricetes sp.]